MNKNFSLLIVVYMCGFYLNESAIAKPLFESEEPINAVLSAPISSAYKQKKNDVRLYLDGSLTYTDENGINSKIPLKVKTRGNFRRLNCSNPPLRLNFPKKNNDDNLFARQNKLKLVGPCKNGSAFRELLGLEYLAYQIWEAVSDYHFKTRIVELSYIDTDNVKKPWSATTFIIEDETDMAKRTDHKLVKTESATRRQLNLQETALVEMFQLLIGNTDYSTLTSKPGSNCCHNARLIATKDAIDGFIPVPYDFDVSGFVNAPYATPPTQYPIENVRQRYFSGWCKDNTRFQQAVDRFNERKSVIYSLMEASTLVSDSSRKKTIKYVDRFYSLINSPSKFERQIVGRCRGNVISG